MQGQKVAEDLEKRRMSLKMNGFFSAECRAYLSLDLPNVQPKTFRGSDTAFCVWLLNRLLLETVLLVLSISTSLAVRVQRSVLPPVIDRVVSRSEVF